MIVVRDEIEQIIDTIRSSGTVDLFVDNTGSYTITTTDTVNLSAGLKVVLQYADSSLNRDVILTDVTATTFTFEGTNITQPLTWEMALYFEVGHRVELNKKYVNKAKSINKMVREYPLVWLYTDFEQNPSDIEDVAFTTTLQGAICDFTQKELYEEQRIEQKFKPVLYPILELIDIAFNGIYKQKFITPYGVDKDIRFITTDRPFFGSFDQSQSVLPQETDAIEWQVELNWANEGDTCTAY
jgi:hypothetical protein